MVLGVVCAVAAAIGYGCASVLQGIAARRSAGAQGLDPRLVMRLTTQLPYLAGTSLDLAAFVASLVALRTLPLFFVQSLVAASVGVTAGLSVLLGARLERRQVLALGVLACGLVALAASARPEAATPLSLIARWLLLGAVVPVAAAGALAARARGPTSASLLAMTAGLGFSGVAVAARALVLPHPVWRVLADPALWAIGAHGLVAMTAFAVALQRGSVTTVTALTFAVDTVLPSLVGLAVLGDASRPGFALVAVAGFVLATGGALTLAALGDPHAPGPRSARTAPAAA